MKYNTSEIMKKAWVVAKRHNVDFSTALYRAWASAKTRPYNDARIDAVKEYLGINEKVNTYMGWKSEGYEVAHGSKALFKLSLVSHSKGERKYMASFFGRSQVIKIA